MMAIWRKMIAALIFILFILSIVPAALADKGSNDGSDARIDVRDIVDVDIKASTGRGNDKEKNESETRIRTEVRVRDGEVRVKEEIREKIREGADKKQEK